LDGTGPYNTLKTKFKPESVTQTSTETISTQKTDIAAGYGAVKTVNVSGNGNGSGSQTGESAPEIRKAIPVQPRDTKPVEIRRAIPVKPLGQESGDETLLKAATPPPPGDIDQ